MSLKKEDYIPRLIDSKVETYLKVFGALSIEGPKWCGKTWTSEAFANSAVYLGKKAYKELAEISLNNVIYDLYPELIDEWQVVPEIWDEVRMICDEDHIKGKFILTGSTALNEETKKRVFHSGAGRFAILRMDPMSLYESNDSNGKCSIMNMYNRTQKTMFIKETSLEDIINLIIRGGWPENLNVEKEHAGLVPKSYVDIILKKDINDNKDVKRDEKKMRLLLQSLARNETTLVSDKTIIRDMIENKDNQTDYIKTTDTYHSYHGVLEELYLISDTEAYSTNYRSSARIGKQVKRHLVDPSLVCALLSLTKEKLINDLETLGFLFESLVERDLRIYMNYLDGKLFHFKDNVSHDEVDAILEFDDGSYAAIEIKLGMNGVNDGIKSLTTFYKNVKKKPSFMCIIVGVCNGIVYDSKNDIYIVPITSLRP